MLEHRFNHDLCLLDDDRQAAAMRWPLVAGVCVSPKFAEAFSAYDATAQRYKRIAHLLGTMSVALAVIALTGAVAELAVLRPPRSTEVALAIVAVLSFVTAFLSSGFWRWRQHWMGARFATEVLRRQHFVALLQDLPADGQADGVVVDLQRVANARMTEFVQGEPLAAARMDIRLPRTQAARHQVLDAYFALRLQHQLDYATHKLSETDRSYWGLSGEVLVAATDWLSGGTLLASIVLAFASAVDTAHGRTLAALTVVFVILGVALRAWRDGIGLKADRDRYERYRATLRILKARWADAMEDGDYIRIASDIERAAEDELRTFLATHRAAQFLF